MLRLASTPRPCISPPCKSPPASHHLISEGVAGWEGPAADRARRGGRGGRVVPPQRAAALCGRLQDSRFRVLPGCGHLSHEEAPAALLELLADFAADAVGAPP